MRPLSWSAISTYLTCPLKYKFQYIDGLEERPRAAQSFGRSLHSALEFFFSRIDPPTIKEVLDYYDRHWEPGGYKDAAEEQRFRDLGREILVDFSNIHLRDFRSSLAVEHRFTTEIDGIPIKGYIDRLEANPAGGLVIIDYKSNFSPITPEDVRESDQLALYQLALEQAAGRRVHALQLYHLRSLTPVQIPAHSEGRLAQVRATIHSVSEGIQRGRFEPQKNDWCPCDFWERCPLFGPQARPAPQPEEGRPPMDDTPPV